jgi:hypothetical protein
MSTRVYQYANGDVRPTCNLCDPKWKGKRIPGAPHAYGEALQALANHRQRDHLPTATWFLRDSGWKTNGKGGYC